MLLRSMLMKHSFDGVTEVDHDHGAWIERWSHYVYWHFTLICFTFSHTPTVFIGVSRWFGSQCLHTPYTQDPVNTLRPRQNGRHFADNIFKRIFWNENIWIPIEIKSLKFVPKEAINNIPALVHIMAWRRSGGKPLSEPMTVSLPTHIFVTRPQWVNGAFISSGSCNVYQWTGSALVQTMPCPWIAHC